MRKDRLRDIEEMAFRMANDNETRVLIATHFFRTEDAKRLMRDAGFGVTGTDILETTKQVLEALESNQDL